MEILPLKFIFDEVYFGEKQEKITEKIFEKENVKVGRFELYMIQGNEELKGYVDQYRDGSYSNWYPMNIFHAIEYDYDSCKIDGKIAYLKSIIIDKDYQNHGIGTTVIDRIINYLKKENVDYLILQPSPILDSTVIVLKENESHKEKRLRLTDFYRKKFGFQMIQTEAELAYPIYYLKLTK